METGDRERERERERQPLGDVVSTAGELERLPGCAAELLSEALREAKGAFSRALVRVLRLRDWHFLR